MFVFIWHNADAFYRYTGYAGFVAYAVAPTAYDARLLLRERYGSTSTHSGILPTAEIPEPDATFQTADGQVPLAEIKGGCAY